jgi:hypothetical protein
MHKDKLAEQGKIHGDIMDQMLAEMASQDKRAGIPSNEEFAKQKAEAFDAQFNDQVNRANNAKAPASSKPPGPKLRGAARLRALRQRLDAARGPLPKPAVRPKRKPVAPGWRGRKELRKRMEAAHQGGIDAAKGIAQKLPAIDFPKDLKSLIQGGNPLAVVSDVMKRTEQRDKGSTADIVKQLETLNKTQGEALKLFKAPGTQEQAGARF